MHITKFKLPAMPQMFAHINRERDTSVYGNASIDPSKTPQNQTILAGGMDVLQKRVNAVSHANRRDLVVCCGAVVTLPEELKQKSRFLQDDFFKACHAFLSEKFGPENAVYSVVHHDETTPHLHFGFVPVIEKERKYRSKEKAGQTYRQKRICADDVVNRQMLLTLHDELQAHISRYFPDVRIVSDKAHRMKHSKSIAEMKAASVQQIEQDTKQAATERENAERTKQEAEEIKQTAMREAEDRIKQARSLIDFERLLAQKQAEKIKQEAKKQAEKENQERLKALEDENSRLHSLLSVAKTLINKLFVFAEAYRKHASMDKRVDIAQTYLHCVQNGFIDPNQPVSEKQKGADIQNANTKNKGVTR